MYTYRLQALYYLYNWNTAQWLAAASWNPIWIDLVEQSTPCYSVHKLTVRIMLGDSESDIHHLHTHHSIISIVQGTIGICLNLLRSVALAGNWKQKWPKFIKDEQILGVYGSTYVLGSPRIERQGTKEQDISWLDGWLTPTLVENKAFYHHHVILQFLLSIATSYIHGKVWSCVSECVCVCACVCLWGGVIAWFIRPPPLLESVTP